MTILYITTMRRPYPLDEHEPLILQSTLIKADVVPALDRNGCPDIFVEDIITHLLTPPGPGKKRIREHILDNGGLLTFYQIDLTKEESEIDDNGHY